MINILKNQLIKPLEKFTENPLPIELLLPEYLKVAIYKNEITENPKKKIKL